MVSAKFRYIGDPSNKEVMPDEFTAYGLVFKKGSARAVDDAFIAGKLRNNSHFAESVKKAKK